MSPLERWRRSARDRAEAVGDYPAGYHPSLAEHFGALGLPLGSDEADTRKAYRELVVENHPDRCLLIPLPFWCWLSGEQRRQLSGSVRSGASSCRRGLSNQPHVPCCGSGGEVG